MRFLADECCDFAAVRSLRADGHDVLTASEFQRRSIDKELMELALTENRILLTEDKDFGWLVFAGRHRIARCHPDQIPGHCKRFAWNGRCRTGAGIRLTIGGSLCGSATGSGPCQFRPSTRSSKRIRPDGLRLLPTAPGSDDIRRQGWEAVCWR